MMQMSTYTPLFFFFPFLNFSLLTFTLEKLLSMAREKSFDYLVLTVFFFFLSWEKQLRNKDITTWIWSWKKLYHVCLWELNPWGPRNAGIVCVYMHAHTHWQNSAWKICLRQSFLDQTTHSCPARKAVCMILLVLLCWCSVELWDQEVLCDRRFRAHRSHRVQ